MLYLFFRRTPVESNRIKFSNSYLVGVGLAVKLEVSEMAWLSYSELYFLAILL